MGKNVKLLIVGLIITLIICIFLFQYFGDKLEDTITIVDDGEVVPEKACNLIKDKIIVVKKIGCIACEEAVPRIKEVEAELGQDYEYIDLAVEEQRNKLLNMGFVTTYIPSVIKDCKVYSGALEKETYLEILK